MIIYTFDESNRLSHQLRSLIGAYYRERGVSADFGFLDSDTKFNRFLERISIDVDLFVLPTRSAYRGDKKVWQERIDKLNEHERIGSIILLFDKEDEKEVFNYQYTHPNIFPLPRGNELDARKLEPCLEAIEKAATR